MSIQMLLGDIDGAQKFLDETFAREVVFRARNQQLSPLRLDQKLDKVREKHLRFYQKIGRQMPDRLLYLKADELCRLAETTVMPPISGDQFKTPDDPPANKSENKRNRI